jgi:DNA-binding beta-propeller fold protein YncE
MVANFKLNHEIIINEFNIKPYLIFVIILIIERFEFFLYYIARSLMSLFSNLSLQLSLKNINSINLFGALGFAMFTPSSSYYYVSDSGLKKIFIFKERWSYYSSKEFASPAFFSTIGNSLYATGDKNIWKLDQNLSILIHYSATGTNPNYRGIYINSTNNLIYTAPYSFNVIHVFNLNLSFSHNISTSTYKPFSISGYNNQMFVGDFSNGKILVIENERIVNEFNGCNGNLFMLSHILFDDCGLMATSCNNNQLYLYYPNGTYIGKSLNTPPNPRYIGFDSKGRFIQISWEKISIYS